MTHTLKEKAGLLTRLRRMKGQVAALERALQNDQECSAILQQIAAVRGAASGLMFDVLEEHLREHLGPKSGSMRQRERDLKDIADVVRRYLK